MSSQLGGIAAGLGAGFVASRLLWMILRPMLSAPVFRRLNYRKHELSTAGGLVVVCAMLLIESVRIVLGAIGIGEPLSQSGLRLPILFAVLGFAFLGLIDDLGASDSSRGFKGHVWSILRGSPSTGAIKLIGGGFVALIVASQCGGGSIGRLGSAASLQDKASNAGWLMFNAALVALSANVGNLFDRAPGRTIKVSALGFSAVVVGAVVGGGWLPLAPVAVVFGAALGLLIDDLREHVMIGDTGANVLGAVLAAALVANASNTVRLMVMAAVLALNAAAELVSFSKVIERTPLLRAADRAGAPHRK